MTDNIDQDTEEYLLLGPGGQKIVGNLSDWNGTFGRLTGQYVTRYAQKSFSRVLAQRLPDGATLVVGRNMQDIKKIKELVLRALIAGGGISVLLAVIGAIVIRTQLEHRIAAIRHTVLEIETGDLSRRIPVLDSKATEPL